MPTARNCAAARAHFARLAWVVSFAKILSRSRSLMCQLASQPRQLGVMDDSLNTSAQCLLSDDDLSCEDVSDSEGGGEESVNPALSLFSFRDDGTRTSVTPAPSPPDLDRRLPAPEPRGTETVKPRSTIARPAMESKSKGWVQAARARVRAGKKDPFTRVSTGKCPWVTRPVPVATMYVTAQHAAFLNPLLWLRSAARSMA